MNEHGTKTGHLDTKLRRTSGQQPSQVRIAAPKGSAAAAVATRLNQKPCRVPKLDCTKKKLNDWVSGDQLLARNSVMCPGTGEHD